MNDEPVLTDQSLAMIHACFNHPKMAIPVTEARQAVAVQDWALAEMKRRGKPADAPTA